MHTNNITTAPVITNQEAGLLTDRGWSYLVIRDKVYLDAMSNWEVLDEVTRQNFLSDLAKIRG